MQVTSSVCRGVLRRCEGSQNWNEDVDEDVVYMYRMSERGGVVYG